MSVNNPYSPLKQYDDLTDLFGKGKTVEESIRVLNEKIQSKKLGQMGRRLPFGFYFFRDNDQNTFLVFIVKINDDKFISKISQKSCDLDKVNKKLKKFIEHH